MDALNDIAYAAEPAAPPAERAAAKVSWRYWTLGLLVAMATFSMVDKMVIATLTDPIKREFGISDTQVGLLTTSFALFFAVAGIPLGIVADRRNRRNVIAICITIWSIATVLCGATAGFAQLLALRFVVGAGESGATPSAVSMIGDLFPSRERARALAIYYLFTPIGSGFGMILGSILAAAYGWRDTFYAAGIPGLLIMLVMLVTVREPRRLTVQGGAEHGEPIPKVRETLAFILSQRSLLHTAAGITLTTIAVNAFGMWTFVFFTRVDHIPGRDAGWEISLAQYPISSLGMILVGIASDRLARRDERWRVWLPGLMSFACFPLAVATVAARNPILALCATGLWMTAGISWFGASYAVTQSLVMPRMRATLSAILLLLTTLLGFGVGPVITGAISDYFAPIVGVRSVGYGMAGANLLALWGGIHFMLASRRFRRDLKVVSGEALPA